MSGLFAISTVGRRTLYRALSSIGKSYPGAKVLVVDDSKDRLASESVTRQIAAAKRERRVQIVKLGKKQKEDAISILSHLTGVDSSICRFALMPESQYGPSYGGSQNVIKLATRGLSVTYLDEDIVWQPKVARGGIHPLYDVWKGHPEVIRSYEYKSMLISELENPQNELILKCLYPKQSDHEPDNALVVFGTYGDPGWNSATIFLTSSNEETRWRALTSETSFRLSQSSRIVRRLVPDFVVSKGRPFQTAAYGFNNRLTWPPFFPVSRGSDALFGEHVGVSFGDYKLQYIPIALGHWPLEKRSISESFRFGLPEALLALLYKSSADTHNVNEVFDNITKMTLAELQHELSSLRQFRNESIRERLAVAISGDGIVDVARNHALKVFNDSYIDDIECFQRPIDNYGSIILAADVLKKWNKLVGAWPVLEKYGQTAFEASRDELSE